MKLKFTVCVSHRNFPKNLMCYPFRMNFGEEVSKHKLSSAISNFKTSIDHWTRAQTARYEQRKNSEMISTQFWYFGNVCEQFFGLLLKQSLDINKGNVDFRFWPSNWIGCECHGLISSLVGATRDPSASTESSPSSSTECQIEQKPDWNTPIWAEHMNMSTVFSLFCELSEANKILLCLVKWLDQETLRRFEFRTKGRTQCCWNESRGSERSEHDKSMCVVRVCNRRLIGHATSETYFIYYEITLWTAVQVRVLSSRKVCVTRLQITHKTYADVWLLYSVHVCNHLPRSVQWLERIDNIVHVNIDPSFCLFCAIYTICGYTFGRSTSESSRTQYFREINRFNSIHSNVTRDMVLCFVNWTFTVYTSYAICVMIIKS